MSVSWPEPEVGTLLYRRLCAGDPLAPSDFAQAFLDPLIAYLAHTRPAAADHARLTAAEDAILSVIHNPAVYNPSLRTLPGFLRMAALADLANAVAGEWRHQRGRKDSDLVELPAADGNCFSEEDADDLPSFDDPDLAAAIAGFTVEERRVFDLMRAGERRTDVFAAILGIIDLSADEQVREAKRVKDRIIKRLQRARGTHE